MKSKMPEEEDVVLGDNLEQLLFEINEFCAPNNVKQDEIPSALENYLKYVAKTGDTVFPWQHVRPLFRVKMLSAINNFTGEICANEAFVIERFDLFRAAPFTIQRFAELVTQPNRHYKLKEKFLRGLEKTVLVVTTVQPKSATGGSNSSGESNDNDAEEEDSSTDDTMVWTSHSSDGDTCVTSMPMAMALPTTTTTAALLNKTHVTNTNEETGATELSSSSPSLQPVVTSELSLHQVVTTTTGNTTTHHPVEHPHDEQQPLNLLEQQANNAHSNLVTATVNPTASAPVVVPESESEVGISDTVMPATIAIADELTSSPSLDSPLDKNVTTATNGPIEVDPTLSLSLTPDQVPVVSLPTTNAVPQETQTAVPATPDLGATPHSEIEPEPKAVSTPAIESESSSTTTKSLIEIDSKTQTLATDNAPESQSSDPSLALVSEPEPKKPKIDNDNTTSDSENINQTESSLSEKSEIETTSASASSSQKNNESDLINMDSIEEEESTEPASEPEPATQVQDQQSVTASETSAPVVLADVTAITNATETLEATSSEREIEKLESQEKAELPSVVSMDSSEPEPEPEPMEQDEIEDTEAIPPVPSSAEGIDIDIDPSALVSTKIEPIAVAALIPGSVSSEKQQQAEVSATQSSTQDDSASVVDTTTSES